jgi:hypothetical protein
VIGGVIGGVIAPRTGARPVAVPHPVLYLAFCTSTHPAWPACLPARLPACLPRRAAAGRGGRAAFPTSALRKRAGGKTPQPL